jgi:hypothetical protein
MCTVRARYNGTIIGGPDNNKLYLLIREQFDSVHGHVRAAAAT